MNRKTALTAVLTILLFLPSCAAPSEVREEPLATDSPSASTPAALSPTAAPPSPVAEDGQAIIADHTTTDLSQIPDQWLEQARQSVVWIYGSTSHGTQVWTGAEYLSTQIDPVAYCFTKEWWDLPVQRERDQICHHV